MHANRHAHKDEWTVNLVRECLHASDLAADPQLLAVVELLAPQFDGTLEELLMVARDGILS